MWTCTITIDEMDDKSVELVLVKDLSQSIIQEVMKEPLNILKVDGDVIRAISMWHTGIAVRIIREPRKYRDSEEEVMNLPWKSALALFDKIDEIYPFHEHAPPEYSEPLRKLGEMWAKMYADFVENWANLMDRAHKP